MNYIKKRINSIRNLNKDRNFAPAVLLGGKAIIIMSFFLATHTAAFFQPLQTSLDEILTSNSFILFSVYIGMFVVLAGKEIIQLHITAFTKLDSIIRKAIDMYSIKYWRKNRKDSKFLSHFASIQYKIFKPITKMGDKKMNALVFSLVLVYLFIDYMRFGLMQMLVLHLSNFLSDTAGGIRIAS